MGFGRRGDGAVRGGVYSNYLDSDELDRLEAAYGETLDRLVDVKTEWDPENVFRMGQDIEPRR